MLEEKAGKLKQLNGGFLTGPASNKHYRASKIKMLKDGKVRCFLTVAGAENTKLLLQLAVWQSKLVFPLLFTMDDFMATILFPGSVGRSLQLAHN